MKIDILPIVLHPSSLICRDLLCRVLRFGAAFFLLLVFSSCQENADENVEFVIGIRSEFVPLLVDPVHPDPTNTGISTLDELNAKWTVLEMEPVFPDVSPDDETAQKFGLNGVFKLIVKGGADVDAIIADYQADQHIEYIEVNKPVKINRQ